MRLAGKGEPGPGGAGDAIVTIEVQPHRFFTRDGDDVRLDLPITLTEAVLGGPVKVPTVDKPVMLTIPKGATSGKTLRLKGKGFHKKGGRARRPAGDADDRRARRRRRAGAVRRRLDGRDGNPRAAMGV